ncbi:Dsl1p CYBJADRAFT_173967 [Cyberlindnera jadinii NRRL Y-1542]|uniref:Retrograde transport protein Dsl1 C-terminal domain-containing protein n=2 Tax=Cyberlindnera jadinii (strain ATCC 18201 / CBS 1600 / BCRC 20928 / JCM 3617 / NBRC 0987 / NRRL Y-1542) TaxID=983966 RepID=A0A1E4RZ31_CYBJN|nr:hypothetical protein CYBJADRAFT_173967 [Cyberlindnera jadinii NRRL Y-1542]ODV72522.1 hypothetical protein CYBJADRAFT_173967 [Cyberlindnera jadinii NRRL Y-1542]
MSKPTMVSLQAIDEQLGVLDKLVGEITDVKKLQEQLTLKVDTQQLGELESKDIELQDELDQLQELWYLMTLQKEIEVNVDLFEFETVFHSLSKLKSKVDQMNIKSDAIRSKLMMEGSRLEDLAVNKLLDCWDQIVHVTGGSVTLNSEIHVDGFPISFEAVVLIVEHYSLPQPRFNLPMVIFDLLVKPLFDSALVLDGSTISVVDVVASQSITETLIQHINSTKALVDFISLIPHNAKVISYISPRLFDELKEVITKHAKQISESSVLQQKFKDLGDYITERHFTRSNLKQWISSELYLLATEHSLNSHISRIRDAFKDDRNLVGTMQKVSPSSTSPSPKEHEERAKAPDNEWDNWGSDDDDNDNVDDVNDDWGMDEGIDDNWGWGEEEEQQQQPKPKPKLVSKLNKQQQSTSRNVSRSDTPLKSETELITTHFPSLMNEIIKSYINAGKSLPEEYQQNHLSKLDYLLTSYYALATIKYTDLLVVYNDVKLLDGLTRVPSLVEQVDRLLMQEIKRCETSIATRYEQLQGLNPQLSSGFTFGIIQEIQTRLSDLFKRVNVLPDDVKTSVVLSTMDEFYQLVINSIMEKTDIGEQESEYLSQIIGKFLALDQPLGGAISEYSKNYQKLLQLEFLLVNHMKEIMSKFYDGGFYELDTEEIVSMLDKLFADSDLKRDSISEIRELRNEQD